MECKHQSNETFVWNKNVNKKIHRKQSNKRNAQLLVNSESPINPFVIFVLICGNIGYCALPYSNVYWKMKK